VTVPKDSAQKGSCEATPVRSGFGNGTTMAVTSADCALGLIKTATGAFALDAVPAGKAAEVIESILRCFDDAGSACGTDPLDTAGFEPLGLHNLKSGRVRRHAHPKL
jgi:hypothetical protein